MIHGIYLLCYAFTRRLPRSLIPSPRKSCQRAGFALNTLELFFLVFEFCIQIGVWASCWIILVGVPSASGDKSTFYWRKLSVAGCGSRADHPAVVIALIGHVILIVCLVLLSATGAFDVALIVLGFGMSRRIKFDFVALSHSLA